jgi:hypothetical protein
MINGATPADVPAKAARRAWGRTDHLNWAAITRGMGQDGEGYACIHRWGALLSGPAGP